MNKSILIVVIIFALAIIATYYPWQQPETVKPAVENNPASEDDNFLKIPGQTETPVIKYPVPEAAVISKEQVTVDKVPDPEPVVVDTYESDQASAEIPMAPDPVVADPPEPLPGLDESDGEITNAINGLTEDPSLVGLFSFRSFIRHFVVTIDNMTNRKLPQRYVFTQRVPEKFVVIKQDFDTAVLDSRNFERYAQYVNLAERINTNQLVTLYVRYYPLFQEAYESLGYPDRYFNDRFIQVIDHLLAAPEIKGPINLVRPKVFYQFADPELESLSSGQKILLRIGSDNAQRVKSKLTDLRHHLTTLSPR